MSETMLKLSASELATVRLVCTEKTCGAAVELPLKRLAALALAFECPACGGRFQVGTDPAGNHLAALGRALANLSLLSPAVRVELLLPAPTP